MRPWNGFERLGDVYLVEFMQEVAQLYASGIHSKTGLTNRVGFISGTVVGFCRFSGNYMMKLVA